MCMFSFICMLCGVTRHFPHLFPYLNASCCALMQAADLGRLLKLTLRKISLQLNDPPYNFMIHTSPLHADDSQFPYTHWFLQIVPHLTTVGGFEIGTGCYINPVFPEDAADVLRKVNVPV